MPCLPGRVDIHEADRGHPFQERSKVLLVEEVSEFLETVGWDPHGLANFEDIDEGGSREVGDGLRAHGGGGGEGGGNVARVACPSIGADEDKRSWRSARWW